MALTDPEHYKRIFGRARPSPQRGVVKTHTPSKRATHLAAPRIAGDTMDSTQSMVDGQMFDSKSAYQRHLKENDCTVIEAGMRTRPEDRSNETIVGARDVKDAVEKAHADLGLGAL